MRHKLSGLAPRVSDSSPVRICEDFPSAFFQHNGKDNTRYYSCTALFGLHITLYWRPENFPSKACPNPISISHWHTEYVSMDDISASILCLPILIKLDYSFRRGAHGSTNLYRPRPHANQ